MASVYLHSLLLSSLFFLSSSSPLFLPLTKDPLTHQHLSQLSTSNLNLVLDLNSPFLWVSSILSHNYNYTTVRRRSIHCSAVGLDQSGPVLDERCSFPVKNPVTGATAVGELVSAAIDEEFEFLHVSAPSVLLSGLAYSAKGVVGLGRNRVGIVEQYSHTLGFPKKFSLCLSNNNGIVLFGDNHSKSMVYTPILMGNNKNKNKNKGDSSYKIKLKSVKVQNKKLPIEESSLWSIGFSTVCPDTLMETKIYKVLIKAFEAEAAVVNMTRVNHPAGRFELCYNSNVENSKVPVIDLVMQSEMVKWRITGHNSMVKVNNNNGDEMMMMMCLGVLDGGEELVGGGGSSIVLGSRQMEDNLMEFDLGSLMIGFTSSNCSRFTSSMPNHVQSL